MSNDTPEFVEAAPEPHPYYYSSVLAPEYEDQLWDAARDLAKRNKDCDEPVEDFLNRYVERFLLKRRYFDPEHGSMEQFLGLIVSNVNAEIMGDLVNANEERRANVWLDKALELHGEELSSEQIFQDCAEAQFVRSQIVADVHDVIDMLDDKDQAIANTYLVCESIRETTRSLGYVETTFQEGAWAKFKSHFAAYWEQHGVCKNFTNSPRRLQSL